MYQNLRVRGMEAARRIRDWLTPILIEKESCLEVIWQSGTTLSRR